MLQFFKNEKFLIYIYTPFLILTIILFIHSKEYSFDFSIRVFDYLYSSWLFNYEFGFMQRGLIGELLRNLDISRDYRSIRLFSFFIFLSLFYLYYLLIITTLKKLNFASSEIITYSFCLLSLSYAGPQFIHELARFDQIFQVLLIIFTILLIKKVNIYLTFLYILIIIPFIALTHEAGLVIFLPTVWLLFYMQYKNTTLTLFSVLLTFISLIFISLFGKISIDQANSLINTYSHYKGFNEYAFRTSTLSIFENIQMNFWSFIDGKSYIPITLCLIYISPFFLFFKDTILIKKSLWYIVLIASPLSLFIIAFDYFRWISLFLFNFTVFITYITITNKIDLAKLKSNLIKHKKIIIAYSLISLFLGPLGVVNLFSNYHKVNIGGFSGKNLSIDTQKKLNYYN